MAVRLSALHLASAVAVALLLAAPCAECKDKDTTKEEDITVLCYSCNSEYDPSCGDPFKPFSIGSVNCSLLPELSHLRPIVKPTFCRKNIIVAVDDDGNKRLRVVRGCGYLTQDLNQTECQRRSGTHDVQVTYCACRGSLCNGSIRPALPITGLVFAAATTLAAANFV